jgi:DNA (cytosine-5)-methyltransferase 1
VNMTESVANSGIPKVLSLFSGAGGMDLGLHSAGFEISLCIESEEAFCKTLEINFTNSDVICSDIRAIGEAQLKESLGENFENIDVLVGGPPCKTFSKAATQRYLKSSDKYKQTGITDEENGMLVWEYYRILSIVAPKLMILENVPELKEDEKNKPQFEILVEKIKSLGYKVHSEILNAKDYGVPQSRDRLIVIGWKGEEKPTLPQPSHGIGRDFDHMTVAHALFGDVSGFVDHVLRNHKPLTIERYKKIPKGKREEKGRVDRLDPHKPSKTVIAGGDKGGGRSHLHPVEARTLTPRECARLQSFPDSFTFYKTKNKGRLYTQIGNAVPPILSEAIGKHILKSLFNNNQDRISILGREYPYQVSKEDLIKQLLKNSDKSLHYNDLATSDP